MRIMSQTPLFAGILLGIGLVLLSVTRVFTQDVTEVTQERALQTEGWQGKRPTPAEQRPLSPAHNGRPPPASRCLKFRSSPNVPLFRLRVSKRVFRLAPSPSARVPSNS